MKTSRIDGTANTWGKRFDNVLVPVSEWCETFDFETAKYKADISLPGVADTMTADVFFTPDDADSGIFSGACLVNNNSLTILAKEIPAQDIVIPVIKATKVV